MADALLLLFAAAMLFACGRHLQAFARRERVLREMHTAMARADRS